MPRPQVRGLFPPHTNAWLASTRPLHPRERLACSCYRTCTCSQMLLNRTHSLTLFGASSVFGVISPQRVYHIEQRPLAIERRLKSGGSLDTRSLHALWCTTSTCARAYSSTPPVPGIVGGAKRILSEKKGENIWTPPPHRH